MPHLFEEAGLPVSVAGDTGLRESEFGCRRRADQTPAIRLPHSMPASRAGACGSSRTDGKRVASERGNGNGNGNDTTRHGSDHDLTNRNGRQSMRTGQPRAERRSGAAPMGFRARRRMHGCDGIFVRGARSPRFGAPPARLRLAIGFDGRTSVSHPPPRQASDRDEPADEVRRLGRAIRRYIGDVGARRWARHRRTRISRAPRDPAIAAAPGVHRGEAAAPPAPRQRSGGRRFTVDAARAAARSRAAGRSTDVG
ncbi:Uncharacterised protein [Burkholderia pseudomallei]|nr:Uncharacterised protein [Burkholderia pseudomallei]